MLHVATDGETRQVLTPIALLEDSIAVRETEVVVLHGKKVFTLLHLYQNVERNLEAELLCAKYNRFVRIYGPILLIKHDEEGWTDTDKEDYELL